MGNIQLEISLGNHLAKKKKGKKPRQSANNSGNDEWYTPPEIIDLVRQVFGGSIDLDPASCDYAQTWIKANTYYVELHKQTAPYYTHKNKQIDGLAHQWKAKNVFLNPPYSHLSKKDRKAGKKSWLEYFVEEFDKGNFNEGIILVNSNTGTQWYQDLAPRSTLMCLLNSRIKFIDGRTNETGDNPGAHNSFFYFKKDGNITQFEKVFGSVGVILKPQ